MSLKAALVALLMASVALAGCSGSADDGAPFTVKQAKDPITEPFTFTAKVNADEYKWELGDGKAPKFGKTIEYVYGFTDGEVRAKLTTTKDTVVTVHPAKTLVLGSGQNAKPAFQLDVEHNWVQAGEQVTLSGASSTDADNDPLLFNWFCVRQSDIGPAGAGHAHGPGGVAYGSTGPDPIPARVLNGTDVPAADRNVQGDLCANMAGDGFFSTNATLRGAFETAGIYKVTMLAKDPKTSSLPGSILIYVTDAPRQTEVEVIELTGSLGTGKPAELDGLACQENINQCDHLADERFQVLYPVLGFKSEVASSSNVGQALFSSCSSEKASETTDAITGSVAYLDPGQHCLRVYNRSNGASADYTLTLTFQYVTDPVLLFDDPNGH